VIARLLASVPVAPDRDTARGWAVEELSKREYAAQRPSLLERFLDWLANLLDSASGATPGNGTGTTLALVVGIVVVLVAVAVLVTGRVVRRARQEQAAPVFDGEAGPARSHRANADDAAARGDWRTAVVERFRAVVRELEERAVLAPQPGRTADEAAAETSRWLPALANLLHAAARLFDDVRYGDRPADAEGDALLRRLDDDVRAARATDPGAVPAGSGAPVVPS
jgi:hypothetical protein